ncbi:hypothetical protein [Tranquillimonas alkanivorans]|uniref:PemK-like, MazF-like toxin of type II toxin-antitoxin system n=1 Tax=Tranquillimonas alkanivorans TaxID=441119 RepID=A0A1I5VST3_9RHOB|nr:hypothetical protein [Tranquillimonas alkanivorans]SFQ10520.1 hypothetical protein SAMN04488047_13517 [Tranquillimonas alkanivorans]
MTVPNLPISNTASSPALVRVGTVVRFAFPYTEKRRRKVRPCLVIALDHARKEVVVAYGTTRLYGAECSAHALRLVEPHEFQLAGLDEATRFQLDRRIRVPLTSSRFRVGPAGEPPVLGRISPRATQRAAEIYAALPGLDFDAEAAGVHPGPADKQRRPRLHRRRDRQKAA